MLPWTSICFLLLAYVEAGTKHRTIIDTPLLPTHNAPPPGKEYEVLQRPSQRTRRDDGWASPVEPANQVRPADLARPLWPEGQSPAQGWERPFAYPDSVVRPAEMARPVRDTDSSSSSSSSEERSLLPLIPALDSLQQDLRSNGQADEGIKGLEISEMEIFSEYDSESSSGISYWQRPQLEEPDSAYSPQDEGKPLQRPAGPPQSNNMPSHASRPFVPPDSNCGSSNQQIYIQQPYNEPNSPNIQGPSLPAQWQKPVGPPRNNLAPMSRPLVSQDSSYASYNQKPYASNLQNTKTDQEKQVLEQNLAPDTPVSYWARPALQPEENPMNPLARSAMWAESNQEKQSMEQNSAPDTPASNWARPALRPEENPMIPLARPAISPPDTPTSNWVKPALRPDENPMIPLAQPELLPESDQEKQSMEQNSASDTPSSTWARPALQPEKNPMNPLARPAMWPESDQERQSMEQYSAPDTPASTWARPALQSEENPMNPLARPALRPESDQEKQRLEQNSDSGTQIISWARPALQSDGHNMIPLARPVADSGAYENNVARPINLDGSLNSMARPASHPELIGSKLPLGSEEKPSMTRFTPGGRQNSYVLSDEDVIPVGPAIPKKYLKDNGELNRLSETVDMIGPFGVSAHDLSNLDREKRSSATLSSPGLPGLPGRPGMPGMPGKPGTPGTITIVTRSPRSADESDDPKPIAAIEESQVAALLPPVGGFRQAYPGFIRPGPSAQAYPGYAVASSSLPRPYYPSYPSYPGGGYPGYPGGYPGGGFPGGGFPGGRPPFQQPGRI